MELRGCKEMLITNHLGQAARLRTPRTWWSVVLDRSIHAEVFLSCPSAADKCFGKTNVVWRDQEKSFHIIKNNNNLCWHVSLGCWNLLFIATYFFPECLISVDFADSLSSAPLWEQALAQITVLTENEVTTWLWHIQWVARLSAGRRPPMPSCLAANCQAVNDLHCVYLCRGSV